MAQLVYASGSHRFDTTNDILLHLQLAIQERFKRGEGFIFGYATVVGPVARVYVWLHPTIPLQFVYDDGDPVKFDVDRVEQYLQASYNRFGFTFTADNRGPLVDREGL